MKNLLFVFFVLVLFTSICFGQTAPMVPAGVEVKPITSLGKTMSPEEARFFLERAASDRLMGLTAVNQLPSEMPAPVIITSPVQLNNKRTGKDFYMTVLGQIPEGSIIMIDVTNRYGRLTLVVIKIEQAANRGDMFIISSPDSGLSDWINSVEITVAASPSYQIRQSIINLVHPAFEFRTVAESEEGRWLWVFGDFLGGPINFAISGVLVPSGAIALCEPTRAAIDLWKTSIPDWPSGTYTLSIQKSVWNVTVTFQHQQTGAKG